MYYYDLQRAAKLLDHHYGDWHHRINLGNFDINDGVTCLLGQLEGPPAYFGGGLDKIGPHPDVFVAYPSGVALTQAWRDFIINRLMLESMGARRIGANYA